jgi:hypothetical protein
MRIIWLVLLGFLAACAYDVACPRHADAAVVISVANNGTDWEIHFAEHYQNVGVEIWQRCWLNNKLVWQTTDLVHVDPSWDEIITRRQLAGIPKGAACQTVFQVIRNPEGGPGDPRKDYDAPGESARIDWVQHD